MATVLLILTILLCVICFGGLITAVVAVVKRKNPCPQVKVVPTPNPISILDIKEGDMSQYIYTFVLPAPGADDVVERNIYVNIDGAEEVIVVDPGVTEYKMTFEEDAMIEMYLVDIDDAGNKSQPGEAFKFQVLDTVPPPAPGAPTISQVEEVIVTMPPAEEAEEMTDEVVEDAPAEETTEEVVEDAPAEEMTEEMTDEVVEDAPAEETTEEVVEDAPAEETTEEVVEDAPAEETTEEVVEDAPAEEMTEEVVEDAPAEETTEEVVEDAPAEEMTEDGEEKSEN